MSANSDKSFSSQPYRIGNKIWLDYLFWRGSIFKSLPVILVFSFTPWVISLLVSIYFDLMNKYLTTKVFYLGSVGIFFTSTLVIYGSINQYKIYDSLLSCFILTNEERRSNIVNILSTHSNFFHQLRAVLVVMIAGVLIALSGFLWWDVLKPFSDLVGTALPRLAPFEDNGWYHERNVNAGLIVTLVFIPFIAIPLGTSGSIIIRMPIYILRTSTYLPSIPPRLVKSYFSPLTTFYSIISISWLIGVILLFYLFGTNYDPLSCMFAVLPFLWGAFNFAVPQIAYIKVVSSSEEKYLNAIEQTLSPPQVAGSPTAENLTSDEERNQWLEVSSLVHLLNHDDWVYPVHQTYAVVALYLAPLVGSAIGANTAIFLLNR